MIFDDFFGVPKEADIDGDGHISEREETDFLYAYDSMMGTNITGCFPENDDSDSFEDDDFDKDDEDYDEY